VGNHENTDIGAFIAEYLDLDLEPVTKELEEKKVDTGAAHASIATHSGPGTRWQEWTGAVDLGDGEWNGQAVHSDEYHEDLQYRRREG
jgi:hypothetical protein